MLYLLLTDRRHLSNFRKVRHVDLLKIIEINQKEHTFKVVAPAPRADPHAHNRVRARPSTSHTPLISRVLPDRSPDLL